MLRNVKDCKILLALCVVIIWGTNFSVIVEAEKVFPPFFLAFLRFALCTFPIIFFIKKPDISWGAICAYALFFGVLQYSFLFIGMKHGSTAGQSSFLLQSQVFFTIILGRVYLQEKVNKYQIIGLILGALGIGIVFLSSQKNVAWMGSSLLILAGLSWACANIIVKKTKPDNAFSFMVYSSLAATLPFLTFSLIFEGISPIIHSLETVRVNTYISLAFIVYPTTLLGFSLWNKLLRELPTSSITPFALCIPIIGIIVSALWQGEQITPLEIIGFVCILSGLLLCQFWSIIKNLVNSRHKSDCSVTHSMHKVISPTEN